jgi:hypothetical protein
MAVTRRADLGIAENGRVPLFRAAAGRTGALGTAPLHRIDADRMIRRRTAAGGFKQKLGCHVFRQPHGSAGTRR